MATVQSSSASAFPRKFPSRPRQEEHPGPNNPFRSSLLFPGAAQPAERNLQEPEPPEPPVPPFTVVTRDGQVLHTVEEVTAHLLRADRLALERLLREIEGGSDAQR
jgi:hypothetical protein